LGIAQVGKQKNGEEKILSRGKKRGNRPDIKENEGG